MYVNTDDGPDQDGWYLLMRSRKVKDYFTSAFKHKVVFDVRRYLIVFEPLTFVLD